MNALEIKESNGGGITFFTTVAAGILIAAAAEIIGDWENFKAGFNGETKPVTKTTNNQIMELNNHGDWVDLSYAELITTNGGDGFAYDAGAYQVSCGGQRAILAQRVQLKRFWFGIFNILITKNNDETCSWEEIPKNNLIN